MRASAPESPIQLLERWFPTFQSIPYAKFSGARRRLDGGEPMSEATVISSDGRFTVKARQNGDDAPASWLLADSVAGVSFRLALVSEARAVVDNLENMAQAVRDKAAGAVRVELREMTVGHAQGSFLVDVHYDDGQRLTCGIAAGPDADGLNSLLVLCGVDPAVAIAVGKPY